MGRDRAIAIVGMACRFPGAEEPLQFWNDQLSRRSHFQDIPQSRWNHELFYSQNRRAANRAYTRRAALLPQIDTFAASHFRISKRRAEMMDPQQRLVLEVARESFQDAGLERRPFDRSRTAVFIGISVSEYANLMATAIRAPQIADGQFGEPTDSEVLSGAVRNIQRANAYSLPGSILSMTASCVAQAFDLGGPALVVDAACAASSAAIIQGVQYLRALGPTPEGLDSPAVVTGGVHLMLAPELSVCFSKLGALGVESCRPFDHRADGFVLGEGSAVLVLKRLEDAQRDRDRIYAVIEGVAWNNDGASPSPTTPLQEGQTRVMRAGFQDAGVTPAQVGYVECHGTGTLVGDPVELASLSEVWEGCPRRPRLGSVKANIGHTLGASGVAGVLRAALALHHGQLPPQAGWEKWHPKLEDAADKFELATEPEPWTEGPRRATVSSFAFGGTNCFLVLAEAPPAAEPAPSAPEPAPSTAELALSAAEPALLANYAQALAQHLENTTTVDLAAVAYTLACRKKESYEAVLLVSAQDCVAALRRLSQELRQDPPGQPTELEPGIWAGPTDQPWPQSLETHRQGPPECRLEQLPFVPLKRESYWVVK